MINNGRCCCCFLPLIHFLQRLCGTPMQAGPTCRQEVVLEILDKKGMPEMIQNLCSTTVFCEQSGLQYFFKLIEKRFFVKVLLSAAVHELEEIKRKSISKHSRVTQHLLTGLAQLRNMLLKYICDTRR